MSMKSFTSGQLIPCKTLLRKSEGHCHAYFPNNPMRQILHYFIRGLLNSKGPSFKPNNCLEILGRDEIITIAMLYT